MTAFLATVGLLEMLQALLHAQRAAFLGIAVLVMMIAADSPVADESLLDSIQSPLGFLGDTQSSTVFKPSALPDSQHTTERPEFLNPLPINSESTLQSWTTIFIRRESTSEKSNPLIPRDSVTEEPQTLELSLSRTAEPNPGSNVAQTSSEHQTSSLLWPPARTKHQSLSNSSILSFNSSMSATSTISNEKMTSNSQQVVTSKKTVPDWVLTQDKPASNTLTEEPFSQRVESSQASPRNFSLVGGLPEHGRNMLPHDKIHSPGYNVPFSTSQPALNTFEPNELPPEDFYPTNTMEVDWGSGDYLETMSYFNTDRDGYSLVTKVLSDPYDQEEYTESYDTSFPSRVGVSLSSLQPLPVFPSPILLTASSNIVPYRPPPSTSAIPHLTLETTPTHMTDVPGESDIMWADSITIQPTDVLLPDMNSLEYYTTQLTKDGNSSDIIPEESVTAISINSTEVSPTEAYTHGSNATVDDSSNDLSGFGPPEEATTEDSLQLINSSAPVLYPSIVPTHVLLPLSSRWDGDLSFTDWSTHTFTDNPALTDILGPNETPLLPEDVMSSSSLTDVHWFVTESLPETTTHSSAVLTPTVAFSPLPTELPVNDTTAETTDGTYQTPTFSTEHTPSTYATNLTSPNATVDPLVMSGDQGVTEDGSDLPATLVSTVGEVRTLSALSTSPAATPQEGTKEASATTESSSTAGFISTTREQTPAPATTARQYLCKHDRPAYLTKIGFPSGATVGYAKTQLRDVLKQEFNKSVELQVVEPPPKLVLRVVSGPVIYTAISVINTLQRSGRRFLHVSPSWTAPDRKYQVHTVLQFVPGHIDVRSCSFSEAIERGLSRAFAEVRRRSQESTNFTVHILNITTAASISEEQRQPRLPVDITFTVSGTKGHLMGSEVSDALMTLTVVEFSFYMGFPVLQIAEPFHYPELNTSQLLRSTWVRTVLLGVLDHKVRERTFQANLERRVALLFGEAVGSVRRVRRATAVGNSSIQVVAVSRLAGEDLPLEVVYFVESPGGERMPAVQTANLLNSLDVQRAAIVLGYRVRGVLAQPVEKVASPPSDKENTNVWIGVGVVVPLLVVVLIISILYWKLCRTDKLEFQPDAMTTIQQRQKLQAPSVKGFDFAKLHLGQQSKDDVTVIQEPVPPAPLPTAVKDGPSPSDNGEVATPKSKTSVSSTKASRSGRRRERISPSDGDSAVSDHSTERESTGENLRAPAAPGDSKQTRKLPINVLNGPPPSNGAVNEPLSSASIFEHVDRMSRAADAARRLPNKIQLIAMQPMTLPPLHSPPSHGKLADAEQIQVALRHKSEIEHHRNKIRLRAKRKGHYDFPAMEDTITGAGDARDQDHIYQKAQSQIDKILDPECQMPSIFREQRKSSRGRRSPKQRLRDQLNGGMMDADKDHLITEDDPAYRKCPGVNNVAYVSDPDQGPVSPYRSPSPTDDVFLGPASSPPGHAPPPPPYMPPQPSIEEARQQMHSLLDDAFALVSPTSQGSTAGITLPGANGNPQLKSPPDCGPRAWGPAYSAPSRFTELGLSSAAGLTPRQGFGSAFTPAGEAEHLHPDGLYSSSRGYYADETPPSGRPRPVGGTTGAQLHHLAQVGLSANGYPAGARAVPSGHNGGVGWNRYHDNGFTREEAEKEAQPDVSPPTHSSASLIKAIREELLRLSQKQTAVSGYRS
ncbi:hypothetical protein OJAV_G00060080 [Oryzias javanicus]|uniref:Uncharacterized protein n=1 Tax=Oryzias javanicus TaxID=123683 RepID=A0A3S2N2F1_ORYJA|nr:hypothetical protein OJAV_G00060080 [Oryzias javanicus]